MVFVPDTPLAESADTEEAAWASKPRDPEALLMDSIDSQTLSRLMEKLPSDYREVLLLREVEDLSYKEIADVTGTPMGTVMSRLSRARLALRNLWLEHAELENADGM
jgi:RNA polymerase sigma-70 factor (ECF subfamily)